MRFQKVFNALSKYVKISKYPKSNVRIKEEGIFVCSAKKLVTEARLSYSDFKSDFSSDRTWTAAISIMTVSAVRG